MIEAPAGLEGVSSSAVREKLREGLPGAEAMLHPAVWAISQEYAGAYRMKIEMFRGEYQFLSNFYEAPVEYRGLRYGSNEAAFQAQKCLTEEERREFTLLRPSDSKKRGSSVQLRPDWEEVKAGIMEELVRAKFTQNEELGRLLLRHRQVRAHRGQQLERHLLGRGPQNRRGPQRAGEGAHESPRGACRAAGIKCTKGADKMSAPVAGEEGFEPSAYGFGDRRSAN